MTWKEKVDLKPTLHWLVVFIKALYPENPFLCVTQYENSSLMKMESLCQGMLSLSQEDLFLLDQASSSSLA